MLHHVSFPVSDLPRAKALYAAALGCLGMRVVAETPDFVGFGVEDGKDVFALKARGDVRGQSAGFHLAFAAASRDAIDRFHAAALHHGGRDNGAPGLRPHYGPLYYAAYFMDADGYRLEAVTNGE